MRYGDIATMDTHELDFELPPELIAQTPAPNRAASRLLRYVRATGQIDHREFSHLPTLLRRGDLLVFNDARVTPARFSIVKPTGGHVEGLFLGQAGPRRWRVMLRNLGRVQGRSGYPFLGDPSCSLQIIEASGEGQFVVEISTLEPAEQLLERVGRMPLPPYIKRHRDHDERDDFDRQRYQTVFAETPGSVAAPTAGLHFTPELLQELEVKGVHRARLTLHVGLGTFKPVTADRLEAHAMHSEAYTIPPAAADAINLARREGRRVIAVGTTSARVLESQPAGRPIEPASGQTSIFIYPPYQWRHVDAMITNFHLPRSTLVALVAALVGLETQRRLYAEAIAQRYRFFSYGDAMLIE